MPIVLSIRNALVSPIQTDWPDTPETQEQEVHIAGGASAARGPGTDLPVGRDRGNENDRGPSTIVPGQHVGPQCRTQEKH